MNKSYVNLPTSNDNIAAEKPHTPLSLVSEPPVIPYLRIPVGHPQPKDLHGHRWVELHRSTLKEYALLVLAVLRREAGGLLQPKIPFLGL